MKKILDYFIVSGLTVVLITLSACSDLYETHEKYLKMGEETYIGLADSLETNGGFNRIQLKWKLNADPKISTCQISWMGSEKPLEIPADRSEKYMSTIINLPEGNYLFTVVVKSDSGKESLPRTISGNVYGSVYQSRLPQKVIKSMKNIPQGTIIQWEPEENCVGVRFNYIDKENRETELLLAGDALTDTIPNTVPGSEFRIFSLFRPESHAIDDIESHESIFNFPG